MNSDVKRDIYLKITRQKAEQVRNNMRKIWVRGDGKAWVSNENGAENVVRVKNEDQLKFQRKRQGRKIDTIGFLSFFISYLCGTKAGFP